MYLGEFLFKPLVKHSGAGTVIRRCCKFLTENPVRAFRNAIAHSNWRYTDDYRGLVFWAKKGGDAEEPMVEWVVLQEDLNFWQALARSTAYVILSRIEGI